eukprot:768399-Hanusia_phi.AAC.6
MRSDCLKMGGGTNMFCGMIVLVHLQIRNWEKVCAVKVQSVWRGHAGRKIYNHLVDTVSLVRSCSSQEVNVHQVVPTDPEKRRQFYYKRMEKLSTRLFSALDAERETEIS